MTPAATSAPRPREGAVAGRGMGRQRPLVGHGSEGRASSGDAGSRGGEPGDDAGSTLVLTIFYGFLSLVLVLLVVAATSLYLERKRLFTVADGAAVVGAEAFDLDAVEVTGAKVRPRLDARSVAAAVSAYLEQIPRERFEALELREASTEDGQSATVTLSAYWRPPILSLLVPEGVPIEVTSVARSVFR